MTNKTSNEVVFCNDFKILKEGSSIRASFFHRIGRTQSLCSPQKNESFEFEGNMRNNELENIKVDLDANSTIKNADANFTPSITPPPGFDYIQTISTKNRKILGQLDDEPKCFSMARRNILLKTHTNHQSAGDLAQYINPDLLLGRRSSLHQNTIDPMNKKIRQKEAYKTAMCQAWLQGDNCAFGDQCSFAHGEGDLQPLPAYRQNPKFKTRVCENYTTTGICPYGNRCFFIHPQPNSKIEDVIEYKEALDQRTRELEGEVLIRHNSDLIKKQMINKAINKKAKQFRKLESCGNFFTQFQLQQQAQLQQQIQIESQAIITATVLAQTAKTLEHKAIELELHKQQIEQQSQTNNFENYFPFDSSENSNFGVFSKGGISKRFAALKNSSMTGSMPQIYSNSSSNFYKYTSSKERLKEAAINSPVFVPKSKKPFLPSEIITRGDDDLNLSENDSSGPHTPPNFYQNPIFPKCCRGNQWGSLTSAHHNHQNHVWPSSIDSQQMHHNHQNEVLPSFSLFGPEHFTNSINGSGEVLLNISSKNEQILGSSYCSSSCSGKRSPIMGEFMSGLMSGRRSSHTPLLDEGAGECAQAMLNMLLEPGNIRKISINRANRSAEVLSRSKENTGELSAIGAEKKALALLNVLSPSSNSWEGGARSTGALNEQFESKFIEQFGPPPGFEPKGEKIIVVGGEKRNKENENKFEMSIKHKISIKHESSKKDEMSFDGIIKKQIGRENCFLGRNTIEDISKMINSNVFKSEEDYKPTTNVEYNEGIAIISKKFVGGHDSSLDSDSSMFGSSLPSKTPFLNSAFDSSLGTQIMSNKVSSLRTNIEKIWTSSLPEIDQNSDNNEQIINKTSLNDKKEDNNNNKFNSTNNNEIEEKIQGNTTKLCYSDIVKKTTKNEELNEIVGQQLEIIGIPYENNNNNKNLNKPGELTWAMRAIKKSSLGNKSTSSPSLCPSISLSGEAQKTERK